MPPAEVATWPRPLVTMMVADVEVGRSAAATASVPEAMVVAPVATWRQPATVGSREFANGGIVVIDEINSGGNQGNTIEVGDICAAPAAPVYVPDKPAKPGKPTKPGKTISVPTGRPGRGGSGGKVRVTRAPSTGVGYIPTSPAPVTTILIAVLPARREDEDGVHQEDDRIR